MPKRSRVLSLVLLLIGVPAFAAEFPGSQPFDGMAYRAETRTSPPNRLYIAQVDVTNPRVHVRVAPGGPDPDGAGEWETTLMTPTSIAEREGFALVVNGDFFAARDVQDAEGILSRYRPNLWAAAIGPAVSNGKAWSRSSKKLPCLVVYRNRKVSIEPVSTPAADVWAVVAGNVMLVENGKALPQKNKAVHPRTVVGLNQKSTVLTILVVDGRQPGTSAGMSYEELGKEMVRLGCFKALNLDGGGSSVMALRDPATRRYKIVNTPSDGRERAVADVLGIVIDAKK